MEEMRLQKYLASCGVASRRKCEELILEGKVEVNGNVVTELGTKINPEKDEVKYNGNVVKLEEEKIYILQTNWICNNCQRTIWKRYGARFSKGKQENSTSWKTRYVYIRSININK